jgi:hypothetical protein
MTGGESDIVMPSALRDRRCAARSCALNWAPVSNPFDNQVEYYKWEDFRAAWVEASKRYSMVLVSRI